jgi:hypothetical protein
MLQNPSLSLPVAEGTVYPLANTAHIEEDLNRDEKVRAVGFVGNHSELVWLYKLKCSLDHDRTTPGGETPERPSISSLSYFQDEADISGLGCVNLLSRPPQHIADRLVENYFHAVHPTFPIIGRAVFLGQYRSFYANPTVRPGKRWTAVLNLVFAIAAKHAVLVESQPEGEFECHSVFFARAWRLGIGHIALTDHPNLQQVQVEALAAFYLLSTGQVNRCVLTTTWNPTIQLVGLRG